MSLHILIANVTLAGRTGTEVVTRDLAIGLTARGHQVSVYTPTPGPLAGELTARGITVVNNPAKVSGVPDIVQGHHFIETVEALAQFPGARGVFVCHDRTAAHSIPPRLARIHRYVAVDENCLERLRDDWGIPSPQTQTVFNAVDMSRFLPRSPLPPQPGRALVFSNYAAADTHVDVVRAACARAGLPVDILGAGAGTITATPEAQIGRYDIVFAKARCAIEAMAVGTAVVLCDANGSGPLVTLSNLRGLRLWNFGARMLHHTLDATRLVGEIEKYDPADAAAVSRVIREEASLDRALDQYEAIYRDVLAEPPRADEGLRPLLDALLTRTARLEGNLNDLRRPERMHALTDDDIAKIQLSFETAPRALLAGATAFVRVRVKNDLRDVALGTWLPFPLHLGYRWRSSDSAQFATTGVGRTPLFQPVAPASTGSLSARIVAPAVPGRYVLRITLVQESLRWLDDTPAAVFCDVEVVVTRPTLLTAIGIAGPEGPAS